MYSLELIQMDKETRKIYVIITAERAASTINEIILLRLFILNFNGYLLCDNKIHHLIII